MEHEILKHDKHHHGATYWASWCSPVGLGIFLMTAAIALAVGLYAILNIVGVIVSLHASSEQHSYSAQDMQQLQQQMGEQGAMTAPAGTSAH